MRRPLSIILQLTVVLLLSPHLLCQAQDKSRIKLFRFGNVGNEKPVVVTLNGQMLDVSSFGEDYNAAFFHPVVFSGLKTGLRKMKRSARKSCRGKELALSKITCIGVFQMDVTSTNSQIANSEFKIRKSERLY